MAKKYTVSNKHVHHTHNGEFCDTELSETDGLLFEASERVLKEEIQKQIKQYNEKKKTRSAPYITYEEEELIYIPVVFHIPHSDTELNGTSQSERQFTDEEIHEIVNKTNQMLAGTYSNPTKNPATGVPDIWTGDLPTAQNDPLHGIDSGIRLKLVHKIPKSMLNPMFQSHVFPLSKYDDTNVTGLHGESISSTNQMYKLQDKTKKRGVILYETVQVNDGFGGTYEEYAHTQHAWWGQQENVFSTPILDRLVFVENIVTGDRIDLPSLDTKYLNFIDFYDWTAMKAVTALNVDSAAVANLDESASPTEYFNCGPSGAIFRYNRDILSSLSNEQIRDRVINLNQQEAGQSFADGTVYNVHNHLGLTLKAGGSTSSTGRGYQLSNQFENPWVTDFITGVDKDDFSIYEFSDKSIMSQDAINSGSQYDAMDQAFYNIPAFHVFMGGQQTGSQATFPLANYNNASIIGDVNQSYLQGWHFLASPKWKNAFNHWPYGGTNYTASVLFHELGHTFGMFHTHQTHNGMIYNQKNTVLPLVHTKKSLFSNADSYIPPFEYTREEYETGPAVTKDFKDITETEKTYLHTMLSKIPASITDNYTRKISVNYGSISDDFSISANYPIYLSQYSDHTENVQNMLNYVKELVPTSNDIGRTNLRWWRVLNTYLGMSIELDCLWGDSYVLLDDDGNNVTVENGGKPEYVVNPTTELVDGILLERDLPSTYNIQEPHLVNYNSIDLWQYSSALKGRVIERFDSSASAPYGKVLVLYEDYIESPASEAGMTYSQAIAWRDTIIASTGIQWRFPEDNEITRWHDDFTEVVNNGDAVGGYINENGVEDLNSIYTFGRFYWTDDECHLNMSSWYNETFPGGVVTTSGTHEISNGNVGVCQDENSSNFSIPYDGWPLEYSVTETTISALLVYSYTYPNPSEAENVFPAEGEPEIIPANRKGPEITSRVPFCVPEYDEAEGVYKPSDVFDPFWFANVNWRDPKNRAYPENWPASKVYDEFDADGNELCPCLYAGQSYYLGGVLQTYTPINAMRTGFNPMSTGGMASTNTEEVTAAGAPRTADADVLHTLVTLGYDKIVSNKNSWEADYSGQFAPLIWNNTSIYIDEQNSVQIQDDHFTYPHGGFSKTSRRGANVIHSHQGINMMSHQSIGSNYTVYQYPTNFQNSINNKEGYSDVGVKYNQRVRVLKYGAIAFPHCLDTYFKNTPAGYKPYPGGYGSEDPIHFMTVPQYVGYVGIFLNGLRYTIFNYDYSAIQEENNVAYSINGGTGSDYEGWLDETTMVGENIGAPYNGWTSASGLYGNFTPDVPNMSNLYKGMNYLKFTFGSSDPSSVYYNPYRPDTLFNLQDIDDSPAVSGTPPAGSLLTSATYFKYINNYFTYFGHTNFFSGQSFEINSETGETYSLIGKETPMLGPISTATLNNAMYYDKPQYAYYNFDSSVSNPEIHFQECFRGFKEESISTSASIPNPTPGTIEDGDFVTRAFYSPYQIFRARAFLLTEQTNFYNIVKFGDVINLRAESYGAINEAQNQLDFALNKIANATEAEQFSTILGVTSMSGIYFDPLNTESCDNGHCANGTPFLIMGGENILCQNSLENYIYAANSAGLFEFQSANIETMFPDGVNIMSSALYECSQNVDHGCYFQITNDPAECLSCTEVQELCTFANDFTNSFLETEEGVLYNCSFLDTTITFPSSLHPYLYHTGIGQARDFKSYYYEGLFTKKGEVFHYRNLIATRGQLYEYESTANPPRTIPLYYFGKTKAYKNVLASTKKFNQILENIIKFTSFAK